VSFVAVAMLVLPPMVWLKVRDDQFALTNSMGGPLFNRVVFDQGLVARDAPVTAFLLHLLGDDPEWEHHIHTRAKLEAKGVGYFDATEILGAAAQEAIVRNPVEYLAHTFEIAWRQLFMNPFLHRWPQVAGPWDRSTEKPPLGGISQGSLVWRLTLERVQALVWAPLCWCAIAGLLLLMVSRPVRWPLLALACVPAGTLLGTALVESAYDRYSAPLIPFLVAVAVGGIACLVAAAGGFVRRRSVHRHVGAPAPAEEEGRIGASGVPPAAPGVPRA
jgi:hypothetical protein